MTPKSDDGDSLWDRGWHEHKVRQLVRLARMPFSEKLAWLESAQKLADAMSRSRRIDKDERISQ